MRLFYFSYKLFGNASFDENGSTLDAFQRVIRSFEGKRFPGTGLDWIDRTFVELRPRRIVQSETKNQGLVRR